MRGKGRKKSGERGKRKKRKEVIPLGVIIMTTMMMTTTRTWEMDPGLEAVDKTQDRRREGNPQI
eukprot:7473642-Karenia_brevis.AAC.1